MSDIKLVKTWSQIQGSKMLHKNTANNLPYFENKWVIFIINVILLYDNINANKKYISCKIYKYYICLTVHFTTFQPYFYNKTQIRGLRFISHRPPQLSHSKNHSTVDKEMKYAFRQYNCFCAVANDADTLAYHQCQFSGF